MAVWNTINYSGLSNYRIDAEYYKADVLEKDTLLRKVNTLKLNLLADVNGGKRLPKGEVFSMSGIPYVRVVDIQDSFISDEKIAFINNKVWKKISKYDIKETDVLVTIVGNTVGLTGLLNKNLGVANFTENCARIRDAKISPYYLLAFFNSKYGQNQVIREKVGTSQPKLSLDRLRNFRIYVPEEKLLNEIRDYVELASEKCLLSQSLYHQAEEILSKELKLDQLNLDSPKCYTANYSEVVANGRCDGEYYQPKYKKLMTHISQFQCMCLGKLCEFTKGFEIGSNAYKENGKLFMRVSNITEKGIQTGNSDKHLSDYDYHKLKSYHINEGDILCTKDGTIAMCYVIDEKIQGIFSSGIVRLSLKEDIPSEYLALVINSIFGKMQANRDCSGALITHWKIREIKKVLIPIISDSVMHTINDLVSQSKIAKQQSKSLLAKAKTRVEELIEQEANKNK